MTKDRYTVWDNCLRTIKSSIAAQSYKTWFEPIKPVNLDDSVLTIQVPNKFFYEWLEEHYVGLLKATIQKELGDQAKLEYQILMGPANSDRKQTNGSSSHSQSDTSLGFMPDAFMNPFVIPGIKQVRVDPHLNRNYTFDNFIEGDCNKLGRSAGMAVAKKPGGTAFNPLVIYGQVGLGKTHLAQAIGNEVVKTHKNKNVLYGTTESFTNQIIQAIKNNAINEFVAYYQNIDILILDDIQFLANKVKTQEIFFHIFNHLHQSGHQIILTSDRPPRDLEGMEERLISRFKWGLTTDLQAPDLETRIAILEEKMQKDGINLPRDVVEYVCYNIKDNVRELEGVLNSIAAQASLNHRTIDVDLAREVVRKFVKEAQRELTLDHIQNQVADHYNISVDKLKAKTRKRPIVIARQLSMFLAKSLTNKSLKTIGEMFGGRDHSTVIYSCRAVQDMMDTDREFRLTVEGLEKQLSMAS
ncbi:MAG: chromosomal replication initiator protein DnaA [Saprospiraceae bacterium]|nr:chromosomal replication initiator protein DnaA [Saprospiraceae bacterium]